MDAILLISIILACAGFYLIGDFLFWRLTGHVLVATLDAFSDRKDKGRRLPVVTFIYEGRAHRETVSRIDQLGYLLSPPGKQGIVAINYRDVPGRNVRIYGYLNVMAGILLWLPALMLLAVRLRETELYAQAYYLLSFVIIVAAGWIFLRLVQKIY